MNKHLTRIVAALTVVSVLAIASHATGTGWLGSQTFTDRALRANDLSVGIEARDDGDGTWSTVRDIECVIRGTLDSGAQESPNDANSECPDDSASDVYDRVIIRGVGLTTSATGICLSIDGGDNWITIDGESPIYDSRDQNVTQVLFSNDSDCPLWDGSGRSFSVVLE